MTRNEKHFKIIDQHFGLNKMRNGNNEVTRAILKMHEEKPLKYTGEYGNSDWRRKFDHHDVPTLESVFEDHHQVVCKIISHNQIEITTTKYEPPTYGYIQSSGYWHIYKTFVVTVPAKFLYPHFSEALEELAYRMQEREDKQREEDRIKNRRKAIYDDLFKGNVVEPA